MKYKITIESGLWVNCECIPDSWQPEDNVNRYVGYMDSLPKAVMLVVEAITTWHSSFEAHQYDKDCWRFTDNGTFLANVELIP